MDFVTFEIAKKLKDKGFREECLAYYTSLYTLYNNTKSCNDKNSILSEIDYEEFLVSNNDNKLNLYDAPSISQVLKWLREDKKLFVEIFMYHNYYMWEVFNTDTYNDEDGFQKSEGHSGRKYVSYELAVLAGIEYVLDNLI